MVGLDFLVLAKEHLADYYHLPPDQAMLYAGLCGISVVLVIVAMFVWTAYKEEVEAETRLKKES